MDTEWEIQPIMVRISIKGKKIKALVDSGADKNHMHWKAATRLRLRTYRKKEPYKLCGIEGKETSYNKRTVTYETQPLSIYLNGRRRIESFDITNLGGHQIILGQRWLKKENPKIN